MFTLIEGLGLRQITARILHELALSVRAAEAVGLAFDRRIDGAIRLHVLVIGEAPGTHIAELPSGGKGRGGKSKHERDRKCGRGVNPSNALSPCEGWERPTHRPVFNRLCRTDVGLAVHFRLFLSLARPRPIERARKSRPERPASDPIHT